MINPINSSQSDVLEFEEAQFFGSAAEEGIFLPDGFLSLQETCLEGIGNTPSTITTATDPAAARVTEMRRQDQIHDVKHLQSNALSLKFILNFVAKFFESSPSLYKAIQTLCCNIQSVVSGPSTPITASHLEKLLKTGTPEEALKVFEELMESGAVLPASTIELLIESGASYAAKRAYTELVKSKDSPEADVQKAFTALTKAGDGHLAYTELKRQRPFEAPAAFPILLEFEKARLGTVEENTAIEIYAMLLKANPSSALTTFETVLKTGAPIHPQKAYNMLLDSGATIETARYAYLHVLTPAQQAEVQLKI